MSLPEPFDHASYEANASSMSPDSLDSQQACNWQEQLLPVTSILQEEDVTILRQQLEAAHQLLRYRQNLVDSLTEQLVSDQTHLAQVEQELVDERTQCTRQTEKVDDIQAVCQDLRSQLRRQQQRIGEYKKILKQSGQLPRPAGQLAPQQGFVPLDQDALAEESAAKTAPVAPWSAADVDLAGPLAIYRKLTEMTMATAAARAQQKRVQKRAEPRPFVPENYNLQSAGHRVELPSFT